VIAGDGGFQMTQAELATLVQEKLDVKIAIIDNGRIVREGVPRDPKKAAVYAEKACKGGDAEACTPAKP
jgi:thiamine pyrophosphate-dependent acetolactate synthase large subunit-like protein